MNQRPVGHVLAVIALLSACSLSAFSEESAKEPAKSDPSALPAPDFQCDNPLIATVNGVLKLKSVSLPQQRSELLTVPGLNGPLPIRVVLQDHPAPLVVVLLGISGEASSDFSRLWPSYFAEAGYNVLTFDSSFRPEFIALGGNDVGISGNVWAESTKAGEIINAFLAQYHDRMTPTKIGLVGMSYGGIQALILGQLSKEGKVPFKIDAIQAYSPPADLRQSAQILDDWYNQFRFRYTLIELYDKVAKHPPECNAGCGSGVSDELLKAAIATSFEMELSKAVLATDRHFCLQLFSKDAAMRKEEAKQWGFERFAYDLSLPWWRERMASNQIDELVAAARLDVLLRHQPLCSEAILAGDDPFNSADDAQSLRAQARELPLTILPHGGHLGYISDAWTRAKLLKLFECGAPAAKAP